MKVSHLTIFLILVILVSSVTLSTAAACNPSELSPCLPAFGSGSPTAACCAKLKSQQPCLCQYIKDPNLGKYVNSPNASKVLATCKVPFPKC
ncbi:hypothetical protein ACHQM5_009582 [Ranunculus cassubicifolius]